MGFLSLVPVLIAIGLALWTKRAILSLFFGLLTAAILLNPQNVFYSFVYVFDPLLIDSIADRDSIKVIIFSLLVSAMVEVIRVSGGTRALVSLFAKFAKSRKSAQMSVWGSGLTVFFDDYANCLIVGSSMQPVADNAGISREKLAYLVDSTAAPVATLALISTWIGYEVTLMDAALNHQDYKQQPIALQLDEAPKTHIAIADPKEELTSPRLTFGVEDEPRQELNLQKTGTTWIGTTTVQLDSNWEGKISDQSGLASSFSGFAGSAQSNLISYSVEDKKLHIPKQIEYNDNQYQTTKTPVVYATSSSISDDKIEIFVSAEIELSEQQIQVKYGGQSIGILKDDGSDNDGQANDKIYTGEISLQAKKDYQLTFVAGQYTSDIMLVNVNQTAAKTELVWDEAGLQAKSVNAYSFFLQGLPYRFYPILALLFGFLIAFSCRDFGPMLRAEKKAIQNHKPQPVDEVKWSKLLVALVPAGLLILVTGTDLYLQGVAKAPDNAKLFEIIGEADGYDAMLKGAIVSITSAIVLGLATGTTFEKHQQAIGKGMNRLLEAIAILTLAWALGSAIGKLEAAKYLTDLLQGSIAPGILPAVVFVIAAGVSFATGTSFGTMGTMMPLAIPLAVQIGSPEEITLAVGAAVLSGATWGDHCSPISDTTVLSSAGTGCDHTAHVKTQLPYALSVGAVSLLLCSLPVGYGMHWSICLAIGGLACLGIIYGFGKRSTV